MSVKVEGKKGFEIEVLGWWIIALLVLVLLIVGVIIFKEKLVSAVNYIKDLFRFRGA